MMGLPRSWVLSARMTSTQGTFSYSSAGDRTACAVRKNEQGKRCIQRSFLCELNLPRAMAERSFAPYVAYTIAKFGMSKCVLGVAGEFR